MAIRVKDFAYGRKIFFIAPDTTIFPPDFLVQMFAQGYEVYFIENEQFFDMKTKVRIIISLFEDAVIFFNIDAVIPGIEWESYIAELHNRCKKTITIGVNYTKKPNPNISQYYAQKYLYEIGVKGGCVQLEYQKNNNQTIIESVLFANQGKGRRQYIRGLCDNNYSYSLIKDGMTFTGKLQDISLSHFTFLVPDDSKLVLEVGDKLPEIQLFLNGLVFRCPVVMMMKRKAGTPTLYVFAFLNENGPGLNLRYRQLLIPNIYDLMTSKLKQVINLIHTLEQSGDFDPRFLNDLTLE